MRRTMLASLIVLIGCGLSDNVQEADSFFEEFYQHRINSDWVDTEKFYSTEFLEKIETEQWDRVKRMVKTAHGSIRSYEKGSWNIKSNASTGSGSSTIAKYTFKTVYDTGEAVETIVLIKNTSNPTFKIYRYNINSPEIQDVINRGIDAATGS